MITVYERKKQGGASCYLVSRPDALKLIEEVNKKQYITGIFYNIAIQEYKGSKHPFGSVWVCVG